MGGKRQTGTSNSTSTSTSTSCASHGGTGQAMPCHATAASGWMRDDGWAEASHAPLRWTPAPAVHVRYSACGQEAAPGKAERRRRRSQHGWRQHTGTIHGLHGRVPKWRRAAHRARGNNNEAKQRKKTLRQSDESLARSRCCVANRQAGQSARPGNDWTGGGVARRVRGFLLVSPDCRPARPPSSRQQKWTSRLPTARPGA